MAVKNKKVPIENVTIGMYISALDRPWLETNFILEGFYIENLSDLEKIQSLCDFVYIDVELTRERLQATDMIDVSGSVKSKTLSVTNVKDINFNLKSGSKNRTSIPAPDVKYKKKTSFATEFRTANQLYKDITVTATQLFSDMTAGNTIDMKSVKRCATSVVDSVVRNPDAFLWLTRLHEKDIHSHHRSLRTSIWAIAFARYLGLDREKLNNLSTALLLCNIGKAKLPIELLEKEDELNAQELIQYQKHVELTLEALKIMGRTPQAIITIIRAHCERFDGSGFPMQLMGDEIPFLAQIAGLVSYYEEVTNRRVPENSLDPARAIEHLYFLRNSKFMSALVEEFICSIGIYPVGSIVELNSKEIAIIVEQSDINKLLPKVLILRDAERLPVNVFKLLDLYEIEKNNSVAKPKIIDTYPLGTFGISLLEVTSGLERATQNEEKHKGIWNIKKLIKKVIP